MKIADLLARLDAEPIAGGTDAEIRGCYISDLLSDVLAHASPGVLWVTIQTHHNVISVASMKDIAAVLITCGRRPEVAVLAEAKNNGLTILTTPLGTFAAAGRLWEAGLKE